MLCSNKKRNTISSFPFQISQFYFKLNNTQHLRKQYCGVRGSKWTCFEREKPNQTTKTPTFFSHPKNCRPQSNKLLVKPKKHYSITTKLQCPFLVCKTQAAVEQLHHLPCYLLPLNHENPHVPMSFSICIQQHTEQMQIYTA